MFGKNKIAKPENHDGSFLEVVEIFPTIQGEGSYAGHPAVFIRLGGCNLACNFCDTEFDEFVKMDLASIVAQIDELSKNSVKNRVRNLVVITGGEPLRQPIERLCGGLLSLGFTVQIESNGTIFRDLPDAVKIICSPKVTNGKYHQIRQDLLPKISALKFIISAGRNDYADVGEVGQKDFPQIPVYVQPMDEYDEAKNKSNLQRVIELANESGYRISLQTHKIMGVE
jgi:7-carboxy-7-deazaguanine synthase